MTEIPVASPTAVYTSYEEPSGEQILISADFSTNHPLALLVFRNHCTPNLKYDHIFTCYIFDPLTYTCVGEVHH